MKVDAEIKRIGEEIRDRVGFIRWLRKHRARLELLPEGASYFNGKLDLNQAEHKDTVKVIRAVGGKFKKEKGGVDNSITYTGELDGVPVRVWSGKPPPSCRIIEVEELVPEQVIPAHVVKRQKMVCTPDLAGVIAIARDPQKPETVSPAVQPCNSK